jgi:hypothetical protein
VSKAVTRHRRKPRDMTLSSKDRKLAASIIEEARRYTATPWGHSRWEAMGRCETEHHLRIHRRVRLKLPARAPDIGTVVHIGLAAQELAAYHGLRASLWQEAIRTCGRAPDVISEAHRILGAYFLHFGLENAGWKGARILGVEEYLSSHQAASAVGMTRKHGSLIHWSTRYDLVLETLLQGCDEPEVCVTDHKTSAHHVKDPARFAMLGHSNPQFLGHAWTWRLRHGYIPVVLINVLVKTQTPDFTRVVIRFSDEELDAWEANQRRVEKRHLRLMEDPDAELLRNYDACVNPITSQPCWAWDWCHGNERERDQHYNVLTEDNYEDIVYGGK